MTLRLQPKRQAFCIWLKKATPTILSVAALPLDATLGYQLIRKVPENTRLVLRQEQGTEPAGGEQMDCLAPLSNMKEQDLFDNLKTRELSVDQTLVLSLISQMTGSALKPLQICQDLLSLGQEGADALQTHLKGLSKRNNDGFLLFRKKDRSLG